MGKIDNKQRLEHGAKFNINKHLGHKKTAIVSNDHAHLRDYITELKIENKGRNSQRAFILDAIARAVQSHDTEFVLAFEDNGRTIPTEVTLQKIDDIIQTAKKHEQRDGHMGQQSLAQLNTKIGDFMHANHRLQGKEFKSLMRALITSIKVNGGNRAGEVMNDNKRKEFLTKDARHKLMKILEYNANADIVMNTSKAAKENIDNHYRNIPTYDLFAKIQQAHTGKNKDFLTKDNRPNMFPYIVTQTKPEELNITRKYDNNYHDFTSKQTLVLLKDEKNEEHNSDSI